MEKLKAIGQVGDRDGELMIVNINNTVMLLCITCMLDSIYITGCSVNHSPIANRHQCQLLEHNTYVGTIRFSNDGRFLFSQGNLDGKIVSWNMESMQPEKDLVSPFQGSLVDGSTQSKFEVSPVEKILAYSRHSDVYLFDYEKQRDVIVLPGRGGVVDAITFFASGEYLAVDGHIWNVNERKSINEMDNVPWQLSSISELNALAFGFNDTVVIYDIYTKEEVLRIKTPSGGGHIGQVCFTSDGKRGYSLSEDFYLSYFDVATGQVTASFHAYKKYKVHVNKIILDERSGRLYGIAMGYKGFAVSIFDLEKGKLIKTTNRSLPVPKERDPNAGMNILDAVLSPDGKTLAISGEDCQILLLDIETLKTKGILGEGCSVAPFKRRTIV